MFDIAPFSSLFFPFLSMEHSHVISERVFGSSKRIQFIGMSSTDSLLNAIDFEKHDHLPVIDPQPRSPSPIGGRPSRNRQSTKAPRGAMSIESLLMEGRPTAFELEKRRRQQDVSNTVINKENEDNDDSEPFRASKIRRLSSIINHHKTSSPSAQQCMTTITCYHASVAQKSYGTEKRFLCPPPLVSINTDANDNTLERTQPLVSMAVICEGGDRFLEQKVQLGDTQRGSFKYLHVTGTAKTKQFYLRISLQHSSSASSSVTGSPPPLSTFAPPAATLPYLTVFSNPISIISKPSKKASKARNVSTCILANSPVSLYNRINSQTVRTKYMSTEHGHLCAKNASWNPFEIVVLRQPSDDEDDLVSDDVMNPQATAYAPTVNYGSEIILRDTQTGVESLPMIIRKVDKGKVLEAATGPVSQMQKVALQLATTADRDDQNMYLLATGQPVTPPAGQDDANNGAATWLDFVAARRTIGNPGEDLVDRVDDYLCWTIVGIAKFEYHYHEPPPPPSLLSSNTTAVTNTPETMITTASAITTMPTSPPPSPPRRIVPLPLVTYIEYHPRQNSLTLVGQHLAPSSEGRAFEIRLGQQQEDTLRIVDQQTTIDESNPKKAPLLRLLLDMPLTQDLLVAHHNILITRSDGSRYLELPLTLARQDGSSFTLGKALACDILPNGDTTPWFIVNTVTAVASPSFTP